MFSILNPIHLEEAVIRWTESIRLKNKVKPYRFVILDGKALRGVAWKGLKGIFKIDSESIYEGKITHETRYFITSLETGASSCLYFARKHWSIENGLHRSLDVYFKEDSNQVHDRNAASNLSILRKVALSLLKVIDPNKRLVWKLKEAAYSPEFRT